MKGTRETTLAAVFENNWSANRTNLAWRLMHSLRKSLSAKDMLRSAAGLDKWCFDKYLPQQKKVPFSECSAEYPHRRFKNSIRLLQQGRNALNSAYVGYFSRSDNSW